MNQMKTKKPIALIKYDLVNFIWISNHHDIHLNGICDYLGNVCEFETDTKYIGEKDIYVKIYKLNFLERLKWYIDKFCFEQCVGYHWTYNNNKKLVKEFEYRKPNWLYNKLFSLYYKLKKN